jgi:hypothetical protein
MTWIYEVTIASQRYPGEESRQRQFLVSAGRIDTAITKSLRIEKKNKRFVARVVYIRELGRAQD